MSFMSLRTSSHWSRYGGFNVATVRAQDRLIYFSKSFAHFPIYSYTD